MRELVIAHKRATAVGIAFRVVVAHHYPSDRLIRTGLASYLPVYPALAEALAASAASTSSPEPASSPGTPGRYYRPRSPATTAAPYHGTRRRGVTGGQPPQAQWVIGGEITGEIGLVSLATVPSVSGSEAR
jgi:hypothetical protein